MDAIVPVPPSATRQRQPVLQICEGLSAVLGLEVRAVVTKRPSLKAIEDVFDFAERSKGPRRGARGPRRRASREDGAPRR